MFSRLRTASRGFLICVALIGCLVALGCASRGPEGRPAGGRHPRTEPIPTLAGQEAFFDGKITAEVRIGAMQGFNREQAGDGPSSGKREGHRGPPGGFGGGMGGGGGPGGMPPSGEGGPGGRMDGPSGAGARPGGAPSGPPVMIHLRVTNHSPEPVELRIADFLSPLGNFVVHPEKLTLAPGASAEVEPMSSGLAGQISGGEVTLKLQLGDQRETKVVPLQAEPGPGPGNGKNGQSL